MRDRLERIAAWAREQVDTALEPVPRFGVSEYVTRFADHGEPEDWTDLGPVPRAEERYRPQGLVYDDGQLWLTDHHRNARSYLYRVEPATCEVTFEAPMPGGALHPGGLALHDGLLWVLDYVSTQLLAIDPEQTLETGRVAVGARFPTGLAAASGLATLPIDGKTYIALSDFLWRLQTTPPRPDGSARTYIVPASSIEDLGEASVEELAVLAYDNGGFSQGLTWTGDVLLEACNNLGYDRVEVLDVRDAIRAGDPELIDRRGAFLGPGPMIEDLATDGERLWTTDEGTFRVYERSGIPEALRG